MKCKVRYGVNYFFLRAAFFATTRFFAEVSYMLQCAEKCFLRHILGILFVAGDAASQRVDAAFVAANQFLKRAEIARAHRDLYRSVLR